MGFKAKAEEEESEVTDSVSTLPFALLIGFVAGGGLVLKLLTVRKSTLQVALIARLRTGAFRVCQVTDFLFLRTFGRVPHHVASRVLCTCVALRFFIFQRDMCVKDDILLLSI